MSDARLRALRMVGFKSFAERTTVEFGPGISAIVGPNGSGKSNLADALRWALGEQGRSLRTRRAEDVIFAGSSARRAIGMADVALVIDNADGLLPVDFAEVELGRRLFRSGENEYLLNRQRIRLRDLVELLDAANLADNAFLFIGQGMVDQALALRPEERRPLFEEAAGIRRHDRRRRHAEAELTEAETNLERVRDVLAELRPQAKRLAAQAEQQQARASAGSELAAALVAAARSRLVAAMAVAETQHRELVAAHAAADTALAELRAAEDAINRISRALAERATIERAAREAHDAARARTVESRLAEARSQAEGDAVERERARLTSEREATERRADQARRAAAVPIPSVDLTAVDALREIDEGLAAERRRLTELRDASNAAGARDEAMRQAQATRTATVERLRRGDADARAERDRLEPLAVSAAARAAETQSDHAAIHVAAANAAEREVTAEAASGSARSSLEAVGSVLSNAERAVADFRTRLESARTAATGLEATLSSVDERLVRTARARGGQRVAEGLEVDPDLRAAVEAVLGDAVTGMLVAGEAVPPLAAAGHGTLVIRETSARPRASEAARAEAAVMMAGGGRLVDAVRRDPAGAVTGLLARSFWVPDVAAALEVRLILPPGWRVATPEGTLVSDDGVVRVGRGASHLDAQARLADLTRLATSLEADLTRLHDAASTASSDRDAAHRRVTEARDELDAARRERRVADDRERAAARRAESAARELAWSTAQLERAASAAGIAADALATAVGDEIEVVPTTEGDPASAEIARIQTRLASLQDRRGRLAEIAAGSATTRASAEERRRRAEVGLAMDEARLAQLDLEMARLVGASSDAVLRRERAAGDLSTALAEEARLAEGLAAILRAAGDERAEGSAVEGAASRARERLRVAEARSRSAEVGEMEARLIVDGVREQLLVELAGIGEEGLAALRAEGSGPAEQVDLEEALAAAIRTWQTATPTDRGDLDQATPAAAMAPTSARLASLRRRYHELGATNPFASEEYAEIRGRLETLEAQRADLASAIAATRQLIGDLNALISTQFRTTFAALEDAFARRFRQLFDGGEARLSLTDPDDLSATGVEIMARPPGKKRQPLAMLSGGERALTAVALLMAMLEVRPVPFCVLDEVDAALDEANIGRFSTALRGLAEQIQFIVITHNRGTIEAADALYGVTVGDDAVSRVVSLRLDDVTERGRPVVALSVGS